jgi:hypothetical protein
MSAKLRFISTNQRLATASKTVFVVLNSDIENRVLRRIFGPKRDEVTG